jgi:hypothetical protein
LRLAAAALSALLALNCVPGSQGGATPVQSDSTPVISYADATVIQGAPLSLAPTVTRNGPVASAVITSGALPPGLGLAQDGTISGTAGSAGVFAFQAQLCNAAGACARASATIQVIAKDALAVSYGTPKSFPAGAAIPGQLPTVGNATPGIALAFALASGTLPPGLALDPATGAITGTPGAPGTFNFAITLGNGTRSASTTLAYTIVPANGLSLAYDTPLTLTEGLALAAQLPTLGNATPGVATSYALLAGALPPGLGLDLGTGTLAGTPSFPGVYPFIIGASNGSRSASASLLYTVQPVAALTLGYATPMSFPAGSAIAAQDPSLGHATPGLASSYAVASGSLPPGLSLIPATGSIVGTPTTLGVFSFTITASNGARRTSASATYTVTPAIPLTLAYNTPLTFATGTAIPAQTGTLGNISPGIPVSFALNTGALPPGLALNPGTGAITGTPTSPGVYDFAITASNGARTAGAALLYTVTPAGALTLNYGTPLTFTAGTAVPLQAAVVANATPGLATRFALTQGALPAGLTLDSGTGAITGTPSVPGVAGFTVTASNGTRTAAATATWTVTPATALGLSYPAPMIFTAGAAIAAQAGTVANATPGVASSFALTAGALPAGLSLDPGTGVVAGTPTVAGVTSATVTVSNGTRSAAAMLTCTVNPVTLLSLGYAAPPVFAAGGAIVPQAATIGNPTPGAAVAFAVTAGSLPPGLGLDAATGTIAGVPGTPGLFPFTVTASSATRTASAALVYTVTPAAALTLGYANPVVFAAGTAIAPQIASLGNATPGVATRFTVSAGGLPAGLALDPGTGAITGTPTVAGIATGTVTAVNGTRSASAAFSYTVTAAGSLTLGYASPMVVPAGTALVQAASLGNATPGVATTFNVSAGTLPAGLSLDAGTGTLAGTPTTPGVSSFTVTASNGTRAAAAMVTCTVTPAAALGLAYATPMVFPAGTAIAAQAATIVNATPGLATGFALGAGTLPSGLVLDPATGAISGTPSVPGVSVFTLAASNGSRAALAALSYTVTPAAALTLGYPGLMLFQAGAAIAAQPPSLGNATPGVATAFAVTAGALPAGLVLDAGTGTLAGTPTAAGVYAFTVTASNGARSASAVVSCTVTAAGALVLGYPGPMVFPAGSAIAAQAASLGNATPGVATSFAVTSGAVPAGLVLDPGTGVLAGTPATPGVFTFTVTASNGTRAASAAVTCTVTPAAALSLGYPSLAAFPAGSAITALAPSLGNATPGVATGFAVTAGALPAGLALDAGTGAITGTPATPGVYAATVTASNGTRAASCNLTCVVTPAAALSLGYATPVIFTAGAAIAPQPATVGNATPGVATRFEVSSGALPAGLGLDPGTGAITGTPLAPGVDTFTVTASNGTRSASAAITYSVAPASDLTLAYSSGLTFPAGFVIATQAATLGNSTPGAASRFQVTTGALPAGLVLDAGTGAITGLPTTPGVSVFTITASNGGRSAAFSLTLSICPAAALTVQYPTGLVFAADLAIAAQPASIGNGTPGVASSFAVTAGSLPAGLALDPGTGDITGTPTTPGLASFQVTVRNGARSATCAAAWTVTPSGALSVRYPSPIVFTVNTPVGIQSATLGNATPGVATRFALASGTLPAGLALNPGTGDLTGAPTALGVSSFTILAQNGTRAGQFTLAYTVVPGVPLALAYPDNQTWTTGTAITVQPILQNLTPGVATVYALTAGALPAGLALDPGTGAITGTTASAGLKTFTIQVVNGTRAASAALTWTVTPAAALSLAYSDGLVLTAGAAIGAQAPVLGNVTPGLPVTFSVAGNALPAGLSLDAASGVISGAPSSPGVRSFTITAGNGARSASATVTWTVIPSGAVSLSYVDGQVWTVGSGIGIQMPTLGNLTPGLPVTFSAPANTLPAGLSLDPNSGFISGIPAAAGLSTFTITVSNGGRTGSATVTWTVVPAGPFTLAYPDAQVWVVGTAIGIQAPALGNVTPGLPVSFSVPANAMPAGLSLDPATGAITGSPNTAGAKTFTVTASNGGRSASATVTWTVLPAGSFTASYSDALVWPVGTTIAVQNPTLVNVTPGVPVTYSVPANALPAGLALDPNSGAITGTTAAAGLRTFTVTASNGSRSATATMTWTVTPAAAITLSYADAQVWVLGTDIGSLTPTLANATPGVPATYSVPVNALPAGLALDPSSGAITGTTAGAGLKTFTVTVSNGTRSGAATVTWTVLPAGPLTLSYPDAQVWAVGAGIGSQGPTLGNATPGVAVSYSVPVNAMPAGLSLDPSTGLITGTTSAAGLKTFTVTASNGTRSATATVTWTVTPAAALSLSYSNALTWAVGASIGSQTPTLANVTPGVAVTYSVPVNALPAGLVLDPSTGIISGTTSAAGLVTFTVTASNGTRSATATLTWTVTPVAALSVGYVDAQVWTVGAGVGTQSATLGAVTPGVPVTFSVPVNTLPAGLSLDPSSGDITGSTTAIGQYPFTVTAQNGTRSATASVTWTVVPASPLAISYPTPVSFGMNTLIASQSPTVSFGTPGVAYVYSISAGALPAGLGIAAGTGLITGTPTVWGAFSCTVSVVNGSRSTTFDLIYTIPQPPTGLNYSTPVSYPEQTAIAANNPNPSGGIPTAYQVTLGILPAGLLLDASTGVISGSPLTPAASSPVTIKGGNISGSVTEIVDITVTAKLPTSLNYLTPAIYTSGVGIAPNPPNPAGGTPSGYLITAGVLPSGLSFSPSTGIISGTPMVATAGPVSLTIRGSNSAGSVSQTLSITVNNIATTGLNYATPTSYIDGTPILVNNPQPSGGTPSSYSVSAGALPAGLVLNAASGVISGTPKGTTAQVTLTITGNNSAGNASQTIKITVNAAAPTALQYSTPVSYPTGLAVVNNPNPAGGTPTTYIVFSGALPHGLALNPSTGLITGTPDTVTAGPVTVTIKGSNGAGQVFQVLSINVPAPGVVSFSGNPQVLPVGQAASVTAVFSGGLGSIDQGLGAIRSGATLATPIQNSPTSITYTLTVSNAATTGSHAQDVSATVTIQWVVASPQLQLHIPATGGVSSPVLGDPLDPFYGVRITVPVLAGTCPATDLVLFREVALPGAVPAPAVACSQTFNLSTTAGYPLRAPLTVTLPYLPAGLTATDLPMPFYRDSTYGRWVACGLKAIDTSNHLVTFTTLLPGRYAILVIPGLSAALSSQATGFSAGADGWAQPGKGLFDLPGGASFGMSAFASWYFAQEKVSNGSVGLNGLFHQGSVTSDDVNAQLLIGRLANGSLDAWAAAVGQAAYGLTDAQTGLALITALRITGQPQVLLMGDARPASLSALATSVYAYDNSTRKFSLTDPNYPGSALTLTWNPLAPGAFSGYERIAGYFPAFTAFAFEGHPGIHRQVDYEQAFQGANTGWLNPPFATINLTTLGNLASPVLDGSVLAISDPSNVLVSGTVSDGDTPATHLWWSQNGGQRTLVPLTGNSFVFTIAALADPYGTGLVLETSSDPCDSSFGHGGYLALKVKDQALLPWFANLCFESGVKADGTPLAWTLEQGGNLNRGYPGSPAWDNLGNLSGYGVVWSLPATASALVTVANDPYVAAIPQVLDGAVACRVNDAFTGAHLSRVSQTVTVPAGLAAPKLSFNWAALLEDAGHTADQQPYVDILVQDVSDPLNVSTVCFQHCYANSPAYIGWLTGGNGKGGAPVRGLPWQRVTLDNLAGYQGRSLKITVTAAGCALGDHGGYAYLDSLDCN